MYKNTNYKVLTKKTGIIIIDFDNVFRMNNSRFSSELFEFELKNMLLYLISISSDIEDVKIRLYGGWYKNGEFTKMASKVQQHLAQIDVFPYIKDKIKITGSIELASSLVFLSNLTWKHTYKEKNGLPRIRINSECLTQTCIQNSNLCPPKVLKKFTQKRNKKCPVNSCNISNYGVFKGMEQKMVDTLMVCDLISCSEEDLIKSIAVVSDDTDLLPSLVLSMIKANNTKPIHLMIRNNHSNILHNNYLIPYGIKTKLYANEL